MSVSLILPCYNPPQDWDKNVVSNYTAFCRHTGIDAQLIIVIDGESNSVTPANKALLQEHIPGIQLVEYNENKGKGHAIRRGVAIATGQVILYTDIDFPYTTGSICTLYNALATGTCDVAIGIKSAAYYDHIPPVRKAISKVLQAMIRTFLSVPVTDTQCGLKGFTKDVAPLFLKTTIDRYLFDLEFIRNAYRAKRYRIMPIPVVLNEHVHFRKMNYRILLPELVNFISLLGKKSNE